MSSSSISLSGTRARLSAIGESTKLPYEEAIEVFSDADALSQYDTEHSNGEDRWITLGMDQAGRLLVVCHTFQEITGVRARVRIFSARKATRSERRCYEKHDL